MSSPILTDVEVDEICAGLTQAAAKVRYLRQLGLTVDRKPNGRPLVRRVDFERKQPVAQNERSTDGPNWSRA